MSTMTQNGDAPLLLYQILEDEYQVLHGPLPETYLQAKRELLGRGPIDENTLNEALLSTLYPCIEKQQPAALCVSGGGIRSATFGLGVLQGLARRGLLDQFHYLSTVSGGGYVGSWLTSWIYRKGLPTVLAELKNPPSSKTNPEPGPIRHLREYSNYLTPQLGLFSADTWTLIATYLRNLFVNWFIWLPLLLVILMLPRLILAITAYTPADPLAPVAMLLGSGFVLVVLALAYICLSLPSVRKELDDYQHVFRHRESQECFLRWCLAPLLVSASFLTTAWAWLRNAQHVRLDELPFVHDQPSWEPVLVFVIIGVFVHLLGWLTAIGFVIGGRNGDRVQGRRTAIRRFLRSYHYSEILAIVVSGAIGGIATWALATQIFPTPSDERHIDSYGCFAAPLLLFSFLIGGAVYVGLASRWTSDDDREWWARSSGWILIAVVAWMGLNAIVTFGPPLLLETPKILGSVGGLTGLFTLFLGFSGKSDATSEQAEKGGWKTVLLTIAPVVAAPAALLFLAAFLALITSWIIQGLPGMVTMEADALHTGALPALTDPKNYRLVLHHTDGWRLVLLAGLLILFALPMALIINVNKFSLHAIYRNRLIRAYLGASNEQRAPNAFTGFDPRDNFEMYQLAPDAPSAASGPRLLHVVNIALNLVGKKKERLAWQERKAESFTVSPLHVGNWQLGYRRTEDYGKSKRGEGISLGTAISISGAAASPNMGYHSSPVVTLLMTLF
ncbi:MAG: patatin-like phospholipase family protein, partial [Nitrospiraceae bacterium]